MVYLELTVKQVFVSLVETTAPNHCCIMLVGVNSAFLDTFHFVLVKNY